MGVHCATMNELRPAQRRDDLRARPRNDGHDDVFELDSGALLLASGSRAGAGGEAGRQLESERRSIIARETAELASLVVELVKQGDKVAANLVQAQLPRGVNPDGPTRFIPLAEVVERHKSLQNGGLPPAARDIRRRAAGALFDLAPQGCSFSVGRVRSCERMLASSARA